MFSPGISCAQKLDDKPQDSRTFGAAGCRIEKPASWHEGRVIWIGGCQAGYANGMGALRGVIAGLPPETFLGSVANGHLRHGVLVTEAGYTAGQWKDGRVVVGAADDQASRNEILAAFEKGAKAANRVSRSMARKSNIKSSRIYAQLAERLRSQLN